MKTLLHGGYVLVNDGKTAECLKNAYVAVENDKITYVGTQKPLEKFDTVKELENSILMPGLYNAHTHAPMVLLRGVGSDLPLDKWLFDKICPIEARLDPQVVSAGTYLAAMEMLAGGTVSFSDMYFKTASTVEAVIDCGMKANIARTVQSFDPNETPEQSYRLQESIELFDNYNNAANGRVRMDFCVHAEYTCTDTITRAVAEASREKNSILHIHLSETEKEQRECIERHGVTPAKWFESLGAFDGRAFAAHCVELTDDDVEILKRHNVSVAHNPTSNMKLASGFADIQKYIDRGLNVALGTDGAASNNNLDMFEEMHLAGIIHKGYKKNATIVNAQTVLNMATVNGAKLQGRDDCGSLKAGNKADIIAVNIDSPHMMPCLDPVALLVYSAHGSDVTMTMVDGKVLYENGEFKTIDREKVLFEVDKALNTLYK